MPTSPVYDDRSVYQGLSFKGSYALKRSASDSEQAFMPFTLAYLKASDALTPGNRFIAIIRLFPIIN